MIKFKNFVIIVCIAVFFICSYFLLRQHYENHKFDVNRIVGHEVYDYSSILRCVFESKNWNNLSLSENFRNKYKTKFDIVDNPGRFVSYSNGVIVENDEELLIISYDESSLFDLDGSDTTTTLMYFKYKADNNKLLDDVELVRVEKADAMTGKKIEM